MNTKECKKMLSNYRYNLITIQEKQKHLEDLKSLILKISERQKHINDLKDNEESKLQLDKILNKQIKAEQELLNEVTKQNKIENVINTLSQPGKTILLFRYISCMTFDEIALKLHYSSKRIYQLHSVAIEEFTKNYNTHYPSPNLEEYSNNY
jgi:DNA-directed RNA polymerase specialized sigma subunit